MTWKATGVEVRPHKLHPRIMSSVAMTFARFGPDGVATGEEHNYTEPNVHDITAPGLAKLARDHERQLNVIVKAPQVDAVEVLALVAEAAQREGAPPEVVPPDPRVAEVDALLRDRIANLKAIELGIATAKDPEVAANFSALQAAFAVDRALVLSRIA